MGPSLLAPAGGWHAVHDGALWAPIACGYGANASAGAAKKKLVAD